MTSIRERNKRLILRAASEEFADKGFAATKTSDIAARAGLPIAAINLGRTRADDMLALKVSRPCDEVLAEVVP